MSTQLSYYSVDTECEGLAYPGMWKLAHRDNPKRGFLFVNRLLGKHIPTYADDILMAGLVLARKAAGLKTKDMEGYILHPHIDVSDRWSVMQQGYIGANLQDPIHWGSSVAVIGMAETATGLGFAVAQAIHGATFIRSTRNPVFTKSIKTKFSEEHCHAATHHIDLEGIHDYESVIIVDDELTTGNTAKNLIKLLSPNQRIYVVSLLNWMSPEQLAELEAAGATVVYLEHGTIATRESPPPPATGLSDSKEILFRFAEDLKVSTTGPVRRCTLQQILEPHWSKVSTMVLGGGEFIPEAIWLASQLGLSVKTTTRSPIIPETDEVIFNCIPYHNPITDVTMYIYNVAPSAVRTLIIQESPDFKWEWLTAYDQNLLQHVYYGGIFICDFPEKGAYHEAHCTLNLDSRHGLFSINQLRG